MTVWLQAKGPKAKAKGKAKAKAKAKVEWQVQLTVVHAKCLQFGIYVEREDLTKEEETILNLR